MKKYMELISSDRVSEPTRRVLLQRVEPDDAAYAPSALTPDDLNTLRNMLARIVPQQIEGDTVPIDLAARLDKQFAEGKGDGWRYATLPADVDACRVGLSVLNELARRAGSVAFDALSSHDQDDLLGEVATGALQSPKLDLKRWFEDTCAAATQIYLSHPQTLASMGYSGIADNAGGFVQLGIGQVEAWEPQPE